MRVEIFSGSEKLREIAPEWRLLTSRLKLRRHHHHFEWHLALAETFEQSKFVFPTQYVAVFSGDKTLVAIIPFRFYRVEIGSLQFKVIRLVSDQDDSHIARDIVLEPALASTNFLQETVRYLAELEPQWDAILFGDILEDSIAAAALQTCPLLPHFQTPGGGYDRMVFLSCGKEDRPFERLSKGFKQNLRTAHNKLRSEKVSFEVARTEKELTHLLSDFLNVEASGWKGAAGTSASQRPDTETFLRMLIRHLGPEAACELHVMRVGDKAISAIFGIVLDRTWFLVRTGYDESYHRVSPGHLVIENLLKRNAASGQFDTFALYNAPLWFLPWKPDRMLKAYNTWVFRPSQRGFEIGQKLLAMMQSGEAKYPGALESPSSLKWVSA
jgi:CelD/BcsL family acetyltransferase involved in cellulose biosynthesis